MTTDSPHLEHPPRTSATEAFPVDRRRLFRGAGLLAGSVGAATALAALTTQPSAAADGDPVRLGGENTASGTTRITVGDEEGLTDPTLSLTNAAGPVLLLTPQESYDGNLRLGEMVNLPTGPMIGADSGNGTENDYIALGADLAAIPTPIAFPPVRILDTRRPSGRDNIIGSSTKAFDSAHRLRGGAWVDLALLESTPAYTAQGAFINVTVTGSLRSGYVSVYAPGPRPQSSTVNYGKGVTIANAGFIATGPSHGFIALRIHTTAATHVVLDLTGYTIVQQPATALTMKALHRGGRRRVTAQEARSRLTGH